MSYVVFARKYRPRDFDEIIGQSHITTTLKNAIARNRVAHAYLFAGPRGVGKTTTARILAKALNCEKGPTAEPCDKCASCLEINSGSSLDILEIDGASNTHVDNIRNLRENARFAPANGRFKVYIIDEVHMLSDSAFNALLKTLEEPPQHVKFIFATTHAHKVPPTILSRCQRFDFRRIPTKEVLDNLRRIAKEEKISVSEDALGLIAKYGDGSMRDSQVILDQIASFARGKVGAEDVVKVLGVVDDDILFALSDAISGKDPRSALDTVDRLVNDGKDVAQIASGLIEHFRNVVVSKVTGGGAALIDAGSDRIKRYAEDAEKYSIEQALYIIYTLANTMAIMKKTGMARIPFEAVLVKLARCSEVMPAAEIMERLRALEESNVGKHAVLPEKPLAGNPKTARNATTEVSSKISEGAQQRPRSLPVLDEILSSWMRVIGYIRNRKMSIASYLQEGDPVKLEGNVLTLSFEKEVRFHKEALESVENIKLIESALRDTFDAELRVALVLTETAANRNQDGGGDTAGADSEVSGAAASDEAYPIIKKALEIFGGKLTTGGKGGLI
ncbi:MAG: DNA polymerase III subunit gamma/tau [Candidatus Omnitrophica bacterium]|nr:DNA polymerase III subunit gamma/tau [Candidatus Omnitrophota bacterium]